MHDRRSRPIPLSNSLNRRQLLALGAAAGTLPGAAWAQEFPNRPIRFMVGFAAGGGVDISARILAPRMADELKTSIVVEIKAGATGMICNEYVAKSPPDGYTLMFTGGSAVTVAPQMMAKPPIDTLADLVPVNYIGGAPLVISMHPKTGIKNLADLLTQARTGNLKLASAGSGTLTHLVIELLSQATGGRIVHVPYKGGGAALTDAVAGHVDGMVSDIPPVNQHFVEGRLVPAAVTSEQRVDLLPNVSPMREAIPGFVAVAWNGLFAPKGTPAPILDKLHQAMVRAMAREEVTAQLKKAGIVPETKASPDAFRRYVAEEHARWGKLVREKNITAG